MKYELLGDNKKVNFMQEIFENRGFSYDEMVEYLHTTDDHINSPELLDNINEAVEVVHGHMVNNNSVLIVVDSDVDGYTSSSILWNFLREAHPGADLSFVNHRGKQHGLYKELFEDVEKGFDLVIVPDAGTNDFEMHEYINKSLGADVVVLDHHDAEGYSENAIVVNSQLSEKYPNKMLSGAGIVWQFIRHYNNIYELDIDIDRFLDLVGLGNVADMMSLKSLETKHLISKGFKNVNNPMFKAFVEKQSYSMKGIVSPKTVGWYVGPLINAMVRVGTQEEKDRMFMAFLEENRYKTVPSTKRGAKEGDVEGLCEHVARVATNVRNRQQRLVDSGMDLINQTIEDEGLSENQILVVEVEDGSIEPELVGLVANKIANQYQKPTAIVRNLGEVLLGSIRNTNYSPLSDFRGELESSGLVNWSRGHASAAGLSLPASNKEDLNAHFNEKLKDVDPDPVYYVDFVFDLSDKSDIRKLEECIYEVDRMADLGLWGQDFDEPMLAITNADVGSNVSLLSPDRNPTIKIDINGIEFMKFRSSQEEYESLHDNISFRKGSFIGRPSVNEWRGATTPQVMIDQYKVEEEAHYVF